MEWSRQIDAYCERTGPEFWAEPLNAVTNAAFFAAALLALVLAGRAQRLDGPVVWSIALLAVIGTGSFLFHTFATAWAAMADSAPISLFILSYFAIAMNRYLGFGPVAAAALAVLFLAGMLTMTWLLDATAGDVLGGSQSYVPALSAMIGVGLWLRARRHAAGRWLLAAAGVFAVSLGFRTIDMPLCDAWPVGTHFVWHVLNGVVLGTLLVALIRHGGRPPALARRGRIA